MMDPILVIALISILFFLAILFIYQNNNKLTKSKSLAIEALEKQITLLKTELLQERDLLNNSKEEKLYLEKVNVSLLSDLKYANQKIEQYLLNDEKNLQRFENLANKVLEEKTKKFDQEHKTGLKEILDPLKERISRFEQKVEHNIREGISQNSALHAQLNQLKSLNTQITQETHNLTKALKGDNKIQGNWGEIILESILEKSGLEKDREYFVQPSFKTEKGTQLRPDIVIHLPDNKKLIIDSKVSLKAYDQLVNSNMKEEQANALKALELSLKSHIDGLSSKNYHDLYQMESPDFVLMFIPIEAAFTAALGRNKELYGYAFDKNVVIVTSSTLLATLKTVDTMWRNEKQQQNAIEIATEAGKMYDKLSNLIDDLQKVGERLNQTQNIYDESMKKLMNGKGNLISKAEKLKRLGAKANKQISLSKH